MAFPHPVPYISEATQTGKVTIRFAEALKELSSDLEDLKTLLYEAEPRVWRPVFTVEIEPAEMQEPEEVAMDWVILEQSQHRIEL